MKGDLLWAAKRIEELEESLGEVLFILLTSASLLTESEIKTVEKANKLLEDK